MDAESAGADKDASGIETAFPDCISNSFGAHSKSANGARPPDLSRQKRFPSGVQAQPELSPAAASKSSTNIREPKLRSLIFHDGFPCFSSQAAISELPR